MHTFYPAAMFESKWAPRNRTVAMSLTILLSPSSFADTSKSAVKVDYAGLYLVSTSKLEA